MKTWAFQAHRGILDILAYTRPSELISILRSLQLESSNELSHIHTGQLTRSSYNFHWGAECNRPEISAPNEYQHGALVHP